MLEGEAAEAGEPVGGEAGAAAEIEGGEQRAQVDQLLQEPVREAGAGAQLQGAEVPARPLQDTLGAVVGQPQAAGQVESGKPGRRQPPPHCPAAQRRRVADDELPQGGQGQEPVHHLVGHGGTVGQADTDQFLVVCGQLL